jgi:tRNA threonylcarbamoyl adenosine modification protein YjeE
MTANWHLLHEDCLAGPEALTAWVEARSDLWIPGTTVSMRGDLGAGKTTLARALIRYWVGDPDLDVTSPTFTLVHQWEALRGPVWHIDAYRLGGAEEYAMLGIPSAHSGLLVVEWAERVWDGLMPPWIDMSLRQEEVNGSDGRRLVVHRWGSAA